MNLIANKKLIVLLITFFSMSHPGYSQNSWEIDKNKQGIKVYTRVEKDSDFKSFKAVMTVAASTDEILNILKNADGYAKWYGYTKTSKLIKQGKDVQYNYVETVFPWPYGNRDMVYKMSINARIPEAIKISLKGVPDYIPEKKGIVRMKKAEGYILLHPLDGKTEVTYVFHSEPGGNLPKWLANNSIAELPFKTLSGLREILK
ncbi:MAG: START domain-containing protein [Cyclobacteriaceae bacterium]